MAAEIYFPIPVDTFLFKAYVPVLFLCWIGTTWTGTWPSNATAKRLWRSLRTFSPCWGLLPDRYGFAAAVAHLSRRAARFAARRIRPAPPHRRCGTGPCGEARVSASEAGGGKKQGRAGTHAPLLPALRSADPHHAAAPENAPAAWPAHPHVQRRRGTGDHVAAAAASSQPRFPRRHPLMAWSCARASSAGLRPSRRPLQTFPARRCVWCAGGCGRRQSPNPSFKTPLRRGHPPGHRKRAVHQVDELLSECHWLARYAAMADTS